MALSIRTIDPAASLDEHVCLDALAYKLPPVLVAAVVDAEGVREQRRRKLPACLVALICVAMNLYASDALSHVTFRLLHGLRWLWPDPTALRVSKAAICQARYRLGARPLGALFHQVCRPLAQPTTPGAFVFGLRLMAIDDEVIDLPDSLANERVYGRASTDRGNSAWPQAHLMGLVECGTRAPIDAGLWPYRADLHRAARRLVRSVGPGMLLSWDQGLHSFALIAATRGRRAHILSRLPPGARPEVVAGLRDGTQFVRIRPSIRPNTGLWDAPGPLPRARGDAGGGRDSDLAPTRLSFVSALRIIREYLPYFQRTAVEDHSPITHALLADIAAASLPPRANRMNPRGVKQAAHSSTRRQAVGRSALG